MQSETGCEGLLKVEQAIIVEGKYDKIKLESIIDATIVVTNGYSIFKDKEKLDRQLEEAGKLGDKILILTEPLCTLDVREQIFRDIIGMYEKEGTVFLKPHPRDELDYQHLFSEYPQFDRTLPMEILNFFPRLRFKKVVGVLTELKGIQFADENVYLGEDFLDAYEDPAIHRENEQIKGWKA